MRAPALEREIGIEFYGTSTPGIGGKIKQSPHDFIVREVIRWYGTAPLQLTRNYRNPSPGSHVLALLMKEKRDNIWTMQQTRTRLRLRKQEIYAPGIKDTNAITSQFIWLKRLNLKKFFQFHLPRVKVLPIGFVSFQLDSHHLLGNQFRITVKEIDCDNSTALQLIKQTISQIRSRGVIPNYFGHQRFGTKRPITHIIGKLIILRDFESAVLTYLTAPSHREPPQVTEAKKLVTQKQFQEALKRLPHRYVYERILLHFLSRNPHEYRMALKKLPLRLTRLFVNAYQAYLFNRLLSKQIEQNPTFEVESGDHVLVTIPGGYDPDILQVTKHNLSKITHLLKTDKAILALPLFGYKTTLSDTKCSEKARTILEQEQVTLKRFYVSPLPEVSCEGGFRPLSLTLRGFTFDVQEHSVIFRFYIKKAEYATVVLREFLKSPNPLEAGF